MKDCLTCRFLDEPDKTHIYHFCLWHTVIPLPKSIRTADLSRASLMVDVRKPFTDCDAWQSREREATPLLDALVQVARLRRASGLNAADAANTAIQIAEKALGEYR